ncbi:MAG: trypsin-like peptidase domain-containing protein [Bacillota bacterium]|nr:trypsin-like peptidase domain-containing protein [Bacillota bacterium]
MKVKLTALICAATLACSITAYCEDSANIYVNGKKLKDNAYIINNHVYVPLRSVSESMGAEVYWDDSSKSSYVEFSEDKLVTDIIKKVSPSVVAIVGNYKPYYMTEQALSYNESYAHGTGVVIRNNGTILTNAHVVSDIENITVLFGNGESYSGTVQYIDEKADLAIVKINKLGLTPIEFGKAEDIVVGSTVIAIGTPLSLNMMNSASKGIISGKNVNVGEYYYFTQSDVAINGGNSGGPLINLKGELIGINSAKYSGVGIEGMSFSIPIDTVNYILTQFDNNKKVLRPEIGVEFTESWEAKIGLPTTKGITVKSSTGDVILANDVVTQVNGISVHSITDYNEAIKRTYSGGDLTITYQRNGIEKTSKVTPTLK